MPPPRHGEWSMARALQRSRKPSTIKSHRIKVSSDDGDGSVDDDPERDRGQALTDRSSTPDLPAIEFAETRNSAC